MLAAKAFVLRNDAVLVWVKVGWAVNSLVLGPSSYLQILFSINLIERDEGFSESIRRELVEHSLNTLRGDVVCGEDLLLNSPRRIRHASAVIAEVPEANEHEASGQRALRHLVGNPELRLDAADAGHWFVWFFRLSSNFSWLQQRQADDVVIERAELGD
jgi:hypothetical protein